MLDKFRQYRERRREERREKNHIRIENDSRASDGRGGDSILRIDLWRPQRKENAPADAPDEGGIFDSGSTGLDSGDFDLD